MYSSKFATNILKPRTSIIEDMQNISFQLIPFLPPRCLLKYNTLIPNNSCFYFLQQSNRTPLECQYHVEIVPEVRIVCVNKKKQDYTFECTLRQIKFAIILLKTCCHVLRGVTRTVVRPLNWIYASLQQKPNVKNHRTDEISPMSTELESQLYLSSNIFLKGGSGCSSYIHLPIKD